jgi:hypothetical protein
MSETAAVRFSQAIDLYIADQRAEGRINSDRTEREYRYVLGRHADDVDNRDPAYTNRTTSSGRWATGLIPTPGPSTGRSSSASTSGWSKMAAGPRTRPARPSVHGGGRRTGTG